MNGKFITIEGIEGCGKSTQIVRLKHHIESRGFEVDLTREPGGTATGEAIRGLLLDRERTEIDSACELLLYGAARAQHVDERIRPALKAGKIVLCDRFADSTTAYQGAGRAIAEDTVHGLHQIATRDVWPDLTIVIDLPVDVGLARATRTLEPDRLESEPPEFHQRVRDGFLSIAQKEPGRVKVVDGGQPIDAVSAAIRVHVDALLPDNMEAP